MTSMGFGQSTQSDQIKGKMDDSGQFFVEYPRAKLCQSYCEFELNKNISMIFILAYIAVLFSAFADHGLTRFYLLNR